MCLTTYSNDLDGKSNRSIGYASIASDLVLMNDNLRLLCNRLPLCCFNQFGSGRVDYTKLSPISHQQRVVVVNEYFWT